MNIEKIKGIAMDLDGTLTQHRQPLSPENRAVLLQRMKNLGVLK